MRDLVAFEATGVVKVELLDALAGGEAGGADPALSAVAFPGGDFALQTGNEKLLVSPGLRPGAFGQPWHRLTQGRSLQRPGEECDLGCGVARRCLGSGGGHSRHPVIVSDAEGSVVVS